VRERLTSYFDDIISGRGQTLFIALASVILSLAILSIFALIAGADPFEALYALFYGALKGRYAISATFAEMSALILTGLAVLIPYRTGFFNIGGQGQLELGALATVVISLYLQAPPNIVLAVALLASMLVGALAVVVPMILRIFRGASEVTTTIMMNFASIMFMYAMVTGPLKDPAAFYGTTKAVPAAVRLPMLPGTTVHSGVLLAVLAAVVMFIVTRYTVFGLQSKMIGANAPAARAAGVDVKGVTIRVVLLGAALAGLVGGIQILGFSFRVAEGWSKSWGFGGIPVAFLGGNPLGVVLVAFIFAVLETGSRQMQAMTGVPAALVSLFQGIPVLIYVGLKAAAYIYKPKSIAANDKIVTDYDDEPPVSSASSSASQGGV